MTKQNFDEALYLHTTEDGLALYSEAHSRPPLKKRIAWFFQYWFYYRWKGLSKDAISTPKT